MRITPRPRTALAVAALAGIVATPGSDALLDIFRGKPRGQVLGLYWANKVIYNKEGAAAPAPAAPAAGEDSEACSVVFLGLLEKIRALQAEFVTPEGVDYTGMAESGLFKDYVSETAKLGTMDVAGELQDEGTRKAFFINVYNALLFHAMVERIARDEAPKTLMDRLKLYATSSYDIGGFVLSLNDIENGVLRGNRKGAAPWAKLPFKAGSPAEQTLSVPCDPRIHFALNCGAKSCPPVRFYAPETVDEDLDDATKTFFSKPGGISVDPSGAEEGAGVTSTKLLEWYQNDFVVEQTGEPVEKPEQGHAAVLAWVAKFLDSDAAEQAGAALEGKLAWDYYDYDWSVNASS
mmetsp:Transcript_17441/g.53397  ORF Transcript_17441/g.53397 Transcript_17441/m.53397 type:complete len:349 (-) Transcript_17441:51-1097(-)